MRKISLFLIILLTASCSWTIGPIYSDNKHDKNNDKHLCYVDTFHVTYNKENTDTIELYCENSFWNNDTLIIPTSTKFSVVSLIDSLEINTVEFSGETRRVFIHIDSDKYNYCYWTADTIIIKNINITLIKRNYTYGHVW